MHYGVMLKMTIPIIREEGYHTNTLGKYEGDLQFMGFAFFLQPRQQQLISVLHLFDADGGHIETKSWSAAEGLDPEAELKSAVDSLNGMKYGDVNVAPFSVNLFGKTIGLIQHSDEHIEYEPYGLAFFAPWSGYCDT